MRDKQRSFFTSVFFLPSFGVFFEFLYTRMQGASSERRGCPHSHITWTVFQLSFASCRLQFLQQKFMRTHIHAHMLTGTSTQMMVRLTLSPGAKVSCNTTSLSPSPNTWGGMTPCRAAMLSNVVHVASSESGRGGGGVLQHLWVTILLLRTFPKWGFLLQPLPQCCEPESAAAELVQKNGHMPWHSLSAASMVSSQRNGHTHKHFCCRRHNRQDIWVRCGICACLWTVEHRALSCGSNATQTQYCRPWFPQRDPRKLTVTRFPTPEAEELRPHLWRCP